MSKCADCHKRGGRHACILCGNEYDTPQECTAHQDKRKHLGGQATKNGPLNRADRDRRRTNARSHDMLEFADDDDLEFNVDDDEIDDGNFEEQPAGGDEAGGDLGLGPGEGESDTSTSTSTTNRFVTSTMVVPLIANCHATMKEKRDDAAAQQRLRMYVNNDFSSTIDILIILLASSGMTISICRSSSTTS